MCLLKTNSHYSNGSSSSEKIMKNNLCLLSVSLPLFHTRWGGRVSAREGGYQQRSRALGRALSMGRLWPGGQQGASCAVSNRGSLEEQQAPDDGDGGFILDISGVGQLWSEYPGGFFSRFRLDSLKLWWRIWDWAVDLGALSICSNQHTLFIGCGLNVVFKNVQQSIYWKNAISVK